MPTVAPPRTTTEPCIVCKAPVAITFTANGGLPTVNAVGYSGLTDDGDAICRDHFCPTCGGGHLTIEQFDRCGFYGGCDEAE